MLKFKEAIQLIKTIIKAKILLGDKSLGKSKMIKKYCKQNKMDCIVIHMAQLEPSDFIGLCHIEEDKTKECPHNWLPKKGR